MDYTVRAVSALITVTLTSAILVGSAATSSAQVSRVAGVVKDETGKPIRGATVTAHNPDQSPSTLSASTDEKGRFGMLGLKRGRWTFVFRAPGFEPARTVSDVVTIRPNPPIEVRLLKGSLPAPSGPLSNMTGASIQKRIDAAEDLAKSGDLDGSIRAYRDLIDRVPALTSVYLRLGELYEEKREPAAALEAYSRLVQVSPGHARALAAIARLSR
jgi:hypothetical protein